MVERKLKLVESEFQLKALGVSGGDVAAAGKALPRDARVGLSKVGASDSEKPNTSVTYTIGVKVPKDVDEADPSGKLGIAGNGT